jgi:hypothetical protein
MTKAQRRDLGREAKRRKREEGLRKVEAIRFRYKREAALKSKNAELDSACMDKVNDGS